MNSHRATVSVGPVEKQVYTAREKCPLVIPQIDPDAYSETSLDDLLKGIRDMGLEIVSIGGSIYYPDLFQRTIDAVAGKHGFYTLVYPAYASAGMKGVVGKTALYWIRILNAGNSYHRDDYVNYSSIFLKGSGLEPIPTVYVFDDRGSVGTGGWIAEANPVPRNKPEITAILGLGAQYSGTRFFILGGGSGAALPPPPTHVKLLKKMTSLFVIPTSGIKTVEDARMLFEAGADAVHVGHLLETKEGLDKLAAMVECARNEFCQP